MTLGLRDDAPRPVRAVAVLVSVLLIGAGVSALVAPALQHLLRASGITPHFGEVTFRTLQITLIVVTALVLARFCAPHRAGWGLRRAPRAARRALRGFVAGALALSVVAALLMVLDVREVRFDVRTEIGYWVEVSIRAAISALVISIIEELWFRGGLFGLLAHFGGVAAAVVLTTSLYAFSHFLDRDVGVAVSGEDWRAAWVVLGLGAWAMFDIGQLGSLLALAAAGVWLAALRWRHCDIIGCIGLHMGFVFVIKVFKKLTYINPDAPMRALAGHYDDMVGWLAFLVLAACAAWSWRQVPQAKELPA